MELNKMPCEDYELLEQAKKNADASALKFDRMSQESRRWRAKSSNFRDYLLAHKATCQDCRLSSI
jgi:hypothetical protein